jgi:hypothetical protein
MNRRLLILIAIAIAAILLWSFAFTGYFRDVAPEGQTPVPEEAASTPTALD